MGTHNTESSNTAYPAQLTDCTLTRDQRRSLWLAHAIAGAIVAAPEQAQKLAETNLQRMRAANPHAARYLENWEQLLCGPTEELLAAYTAPTPHGCDLRQNAPFAGLLDDTQRRTILENWKNINTT